MLSTFPTKVRLRAGVWLIVALLALLLGRQLVVTWVLARGELAAVELEKQLPPEEGAEVTEESGAPLFGWFDSVGGARPGSFVSEKPSPRLMKASGTSGVRLAPLPPASVRLSRARVVELASAGLAPGGVERPAAWGMPAGVEVLAGDSLGIGWFPGDRIVAVAGIPVVSRGAVVEAVLAARGRQEATIVAQVARRTRQGVVTFEVLVEQPYPE